MTDEEREEQEKFLTVHLPYRMTHLDGLIWACQAISRYGLEADLAITVGAHETIKGPLWIITNPLQEAGLIQCRVVANFLGIKLEHEKANFGVDQGGDKHYICKIKMYNDKDEPLAAVSEDDLKNKYGAKINELLDCIKDTLRWASEGSAHLMASKNLMDCDITVKCAESLLWLVEEKVYKPLGRDVPNYKKWTGK